MVQRLWMQKHCKSNLFDIFLLIKKWIVNRAVSCCLICLSKYVSHVSVFLVFLQSSFFIYVYFWRNLSCFAFRILKKDVGKLLMFCGTWHEPSLTFLFLVFYFSGCRRKSGHQLFQWLHTHCVERSGTQASSPVQVTVRPHSRLWPLRFADSNRHSG